MDVDTITVLPAAELEVKHHADGSVEPTIRNHQSMDSMVTVRLSDPKSSIAEDLSTGHELVEEEALEEFPKMDVEYCTARRSNNVLYEHQAPMLLEEAKVLHSIRRDSLASTQRESTMSVLSAVEEGSFDAASSTIRSRSDSSGTYSSIGSAHVDWDELDRSEEKAPRDEGSDKVRHMNS